MSQRRPAASELESRTIARVSARLVPFLIGCYFVAYLDRVNVGFAALTMNQDLQLSASAFGVSNLQAGIITAVPYVAGSLAIVWWPRHSDRTLERRFHLAAALFLASAGIAASTALDDPAQKMIALTAAGAGIFACLPVFWTLPTAFLSGAAAAGGIALINSIGNLAGFAGPYAVGLLKDATGSYTPGLLTLTVRAWSERSSCCCSVTIGRWSIRLEMRPEQPQRSFPERIASSRVRRSALAKLKDSPSSTTWASDRPSKAFPYSLSSASAIRMWRTSRRASRWAPFGYGS